MIFLQPERQAVCVESDYEIHLRRFPLGHSTGCLLAVGLPGIGVPPGGMDTLNPNTNLGGGSRWCDRVDPGFVLVAGEGAGLGEILI